MKDEIGEGGEFLPNVRRILPIGTRISVSAFGCFQRAGFGGIPFSSCEEFSEIGQVAAARFLENAQAEMRNDRQEMIEDVALDALVGDPADIVGEQVKFQRQPLWRRG